MRRLREYVCALSLALVIVGGSACLASAQLASDRVFSPEAVASLAKARTAAAADRHRDAIHWYLRAIEQSPELERELGRELGDQYTWADSPDTAITWYRLHLDRHPDDFDARLGLARALAWSDRLGEAQDAYRDLLPSAGERENDVWLGIAAVTAWQDKLWPARRIYERILDGDPNHLDARIGRAQVINWAGRHREARGLYEDLYAEHPDHREVRGGLASAQHWLGRPDRAVAILDATPRHPALDDLEREIRGSRAPGASYTFSHNEDSDDIERDSHAIEAALSPAWRTRTGVRYARGEITQPGLPDVTRDAISLSLSQRFSEALALSVSPGYEWNAFDREALGPEAFWQNEHQLFTLDAYLTLTPADWVRADFGVYRGSLDNPVPTFRGIDLVETSAGLDWRMAPTVLTITEVSYTGYSDDNARVAASARAEWRPAQCLPVPIQHRFSFTTGVGYLDFKEALDHGYYNPDQYTSLYEIVAVEMSFTRRVRVALSGRFAAEREDTGAWFSGGSFSASASLRTIDRLTVNGGYYTSRSRFDTRAGYEADGFWVGVEY